MTAIDSFAPIEGATVHVLVLGTMPGVASLTANAYYAHPRNAFWPIVIAWSGDGRPDVTAAIALPYAERVRRVTAAGMAVWDVLASCVRPGSLDSAIERASERPNDIAALVARHPELECIVCNGRTAARLLARHVGALPDTVTVRAAPSTSPAMASLTLQDKYRLWCEALPTATCAKAD